MTNEQKAKMRFIAKRWLLATQARLHSCRAELADAERAYAWALKEHKAVEDMIARDERLEGV